MTSPTETFFQSTDLEHSLLIGYYGGGNYGDELLLEIIANLLKSNSVQHMTIAYLEPKRYKTFHHNFGYPHIPTGDKKQLLKHILKNKKIIIGGGGLWGLDANTQLFFLSLLLFLAHYVLRKKVYLLGVGYYSSTSKLGHISAWLAGKAATHIIARDKETLQNFRKITNHVALDHDLAWQIPNLDLKAYEPDLKELEKTLPVKQKTLFITLRRFKASQKNRYVELVDRCITNNPDKNIIISLMEPKSIDPKGYKLIRSWQKKHRHVRVTDFSYNPFALYLFFRTYRDKLVLIGPQFHTIITAHLCKVPYLPVVYDNKVAALLKEVGSAKQISIKELELADMQQFIDTNFARGPS